MIRLQKAIHHHCLKVSFYFSERSELKNQFLTGKLFFQKFRKMTTKLKRCDFTSYFLTKSENTKKIVKSHAENSIFWRENSKITKLPKLSKNSSNHNKTKIKHCDFTSYFLTQIKINESMKVQSKKLVKTQQSKQIAIFRPI